eukprot:scaffold2671_cov252-Pinguiococcus_pyrenoidosus.AAC.11
MGLQAADGSFPVPNAPKGDQRSPASGAIAVAALVAGLSCVHDWVPFGAVSRETRGLRRDFTTICANPFGRAKERACPKERACASA